MHPQEKSLHGFLRLPDVLKLYPISKSAWWQGVKDGIYPKPVKLSPRTSAWRADEIHQLIENTIQQGAHHHE